MRSGSDPKALHVANDLRLAHGDLKDALKLHEHGSRNEAYHLEQAVEKVILALLTSEDIHVEVRETHRLEQLVDKLPDDHPLKDALGKLAFLQSYATAFRYVKTAGRIPASFPPERFTPTSNALRKLIDGVARHFQVDLEAGDHIPAGNTDPMRSGIPGDTSGPKR